MGTLDWLKQPFAHRGLHDREKGLIENSRSAFQAAIDAGFGLECDVQEAGDGGAVVFHDVQLDRLTGRSGHVKDLSIAELKKIRLKNSTDHLQSLEDLLAQVSGRVPLLIEIKSDWKRRGPFETKLAETLKNYDGYHAVMSFDPKAVSAFSAAAPDVPRGLIAGSFRNPLYWGHLSSWQQFTMRHLLTAFIVRPHFVAYDIEAMPMLAPSIWRTVLRRPLLAWTVSTEENKARARQMADAMIFEKIRP